MSEKKLKRFLIILIIMVIFVAVLFVTLLKLNKNNRNISSNSDEISKLNANEVAIEDIPETEVSEKNNTWQEVKNISEYYAVEGITTSFFQKIQEFNDSEEEQGKAGSKEAIKDMLNNYIVEDNISDAQLEQFIKKYSGESFEIERMYSKNQGNLINTYFIQGKLSNKDKNYNFIVILDRQTNYYTILPNEYIREKYGESIQLDNITFSEDMLNIKKELYNLIYYNEVTNADVSMDYFSSYINTLKQNTKKVYELLDEEYKQRRFGSYENFENYVKKNYSNLTSRKLSSYNVNADDDGNITYLLKDQYDNYYIFKASAVLHYTLQLDDYTLENKNFNSSYASVSNRDKGLLNCQKFFKMINMKDYTAAYNVLDSNFKKKYFPTQSDFENYVNSKFFTINKVSYDEYSNQIPSIHTFKTTITDATNQSTNQVKFNIVMSLGDGTNFTMSFEVD